MLPFYQTNLLHHFKHVQAWVSEHQATASVTMPDGVLRVQCGNRTFDFQPQFRALGQDNKPIIWFELTPSATGFFGWLPYFNKQWDVARSKLAFKKFASELGLRTTAISHLRNDELQEVLIKRDVSSFSEGIRGPYRLDSVDPAITQLGEGEFYEQFINGKILKAQYWNGRPVAVELYEPACVRGDGRRTIRELVADKPRITPRPVNEAIVQAMVEFMGHTLEDVPLPLERVRVDYRYGSALFDIALHNTNTLATLDPIIGDQIALAGPLLELAIPEPIRKNTVFSADAMVDDAGNVWFLEMNCNPHLHPDIYPAMLDSLFADADVIGDNLKPLHLRQHNPFAVAPATSPQIPNAPGKPQT